MLDDAIPNEEIVELHNLVKNDSSLRSQLVDHLLLDTLLAENLGKEPLTALVDLVGEVTHPPADTGPLSQARQQHSNMSVSPAAKRWSWISGWLVLAASLLLVISLFVFQDNRAAFANAAQIVQAAIHTHAAPIERVYFVEVKRYDPNRNKFGMPRDVRVYTQGDRFWVEMRGFHNWAWGRNEQGAIWMTLGPERAVVVNPDEMGIPLHYLGDFYTLHLETLLNSFLKHCRLEMSDGPADSTVIVATPRRPWSSRPLQRATIEVDRETKAIRKLVIEREFQRSRSISTFTLVDSRWPDESLYGPEGHLREPFQIFSTDTPAALRRELITSWFGPTSEPWMQIPESEGK